MDNCDSAGVFELDFELASFQIGSPVTQGDFDSLSAKFTRLPSGKLWVPSFIRFQYGRLSRDCKPHGSAFAALARHGLDPKTVEQVTSPTEVHEVQGTLEDSLSKGFPKGIQTLEEKDKDKEKEKDKGIGGVEAAEINTLYPRKTGRQDALRAIVKALAQNPAEKLKEATAAYAAAVSLWSVEDSEIHSASGHVVQQGELRRRPRNVGQERQQQQPHREDHR